MSRRPRSGARRRVVHAPGWCGLVMERAAPALEPSLGGATAGRSSSGVALPVERKLPPCLVAGHGDRVRQVQAAAGRAHRDPQPALGRVARQHRIREPARLRAEQQRVSFPERGVAMAGLAPDREGERPPRGVDGVEGVERGVLAHRRPLVVVEAGASQAGFVEPESQRSDEVQDAAGVGAKAYDVARVRGDFRLIEDDVEHGPGPG